MAEPALTVLMTVRNGEPYLHDAVSSILKQTYDSFRFLILDNASTDNSRQVIRGFNDPRIDLVELPEDMGQTAALNRALQMIETPWIARMDADDVCSPQRLELQMSALEADRSLSCIGTFCWVFRADPKRVDGTIVLPVHYEDLKRVNVAGCPMVHPTIVVSRQVLVDIGAYDERYRVSADVELYERLLRGHRAENLPSLLYGCRFHPNQQSGSRLGLEENIAIWRERLIRNQYTAKEAPLVRASLSRHIVGRVGYLWSEEQYRASLKDLWRAFHLSPKSVTRWYAGSLMHFLIPPRVRTIIRGKFMQIDDTLTCIFTKRL